MKLLLTASYSLLVFIDVAIASAYKQEKGISVIKQLQQQSKYWT